MTPIDPPLHAIQQTILSPEVSFSDGIGRFACDDRFAITLDDWLILIAYQSFHFSQSHSTNDWKVSIKSISTNPELSLFEVFSGDVVVAHAAKLTPFQPLAKLLHQGGMPPESIQKDWRRQLAKSGKSIPNVCRILCRPDGILMVIPDIDPSPLRQQLSFHSPAGQSQLDQIAPEKFQQWKPISWPWQLSKPTSETTPQLANLPKESSEKPSEELSGTPKKSTFPVALGKPSAASGTFHSGNRQKKSSKRKPTNKRTFVIVGSLAVTAFVTTALIWHSLPGSNSKPNQQARSKAENKSQSETKSSQTEQASMIEELPTEKLDVSNDTDMTELASSDSLPSLDSLTSDLDSYSQLEGQLQNQVVLDELDTSNIIARSLKREKENPASPNSESTNPTIDLPSVAEPGTTMPEILNGETTDDTASDTTTDNEAVEPEAIADNTRRKDSISAASKKEKVNFGFSVVPKEAKWSAQLFVVDPAPESLVVSPEDITHSVGPGKVTWTLGLEDEDPELIVEIVAKPGRRWEIVWQVGFRESNDIPARLLGPKDATSVLSQLISAKSFIGRMLTQNQVARDSGVRGPIDLFEQRRQLQRQDRELEQAIEKWKIIESLSRVVFQQTQVEFQALTPATPQEPIQEPARQE
ncbi:MAG: hypothetical protein MUC83_16120 [Pirellula sp.]|nr:hypothetical protein [Pirellula sp.]